MCWSGRWRRSWSASGRDIMRSTRCRIHWSAGRWRRRGRAISRQERQDAKKFVARMHQARTRTAKPLAVAVLGMAFSLAEAQRRKEHVRASLPHDRTLGDHRERVAGGGAVVDY